MNQLNRLLTGLVLTSAFLAAPMALAGKGHNHHGHHAACKEDAEKFCAGKKGKEKHECLKSHEAELSQACKEAMAKHGHHDEGAHTDHQ